MSKSLLPGTPAGTNGRLKMIVARIVQATAIGHIQRYFAPRFQAPGSKSSPARHRRYTGATYATYRPIVVIDTTALNAHGTPAALPPSAGRVMISAQTATASTEYSGTRRLSTLLQIRQPGIARSRENACHVREALVRPAMPQNTWPIVEIRITASAHPELIALVNTDSDVPPALLIAPTSVAANVIASSTNQPNSAA